MYGLSRRRLLGGVSAAAVALVALVAWDVGGVRALLPGAGNTPASIRMAVLPFENLSGDPDHEPLGAGLTDDVIFQLGRLNPDRLSVVSRSSVLRYKDAPQPLQIVAEQLSAAYILESSYRSEGGRFLVNARLIRSSDQSQVWSNSYDRNLAGLPALQRDLVSGITESLAVTLLPEEQARLDALGQVNPEAYEAYHRGKVSWERQTPASLDTAMGYFELALEHDPEYALAHIGVADVWSSRTIHGMISATEAYPLAKTALRAAFDQDDAFPQAYATQAVIRCWYEWDWDGAEEAFLRAIDLDPSDSETRGVYSQYLTMMRRFDEAVVQMDEAMQLSPLDPFLPSLHATDLLFMKRHEEAVELARRVLDEVPSHEVASTVLADGLYLLGRFDEEFDAHRMRAVLSGDREIEEALDRGYQAEGYRGAMRFVADLLAARSEQQYVSPVTVMSHYVRAGELERAMDWAEEAFEQRDLNVPVFGVLPLVDALRGEPRFDVMIRELGFPFNG